MSRASRTHFAQQVHADAHAVVALRDMLRFVNAAPRTREEVRAELQRRITERCQQMHLPPDSLHDELESAEDDGAARRLTR